MACAGLAGAMAWAATAGADPRAVTGSFDLPIACLGLVLVGFFVWMAGMARRERAESAAWAKLYAARRVAVVQTPSSRRPVTRTPASRAPDSLAA